MDAINRTILELKLVTFGINHIKTTTINRTILELKLRSTAHTVDHQMTINRTILELKHGITDLVIFPLSLLIEPFWN